MNEIALTRPAELSVRSIMSYGSPEEALIALIGATHLLWSRNTIIAYSRDLLDYCRFCDTVQCNPLPINEDCLCEYIEAQSADNSPATIRRKISSINAVCAALDLPLPKSLSRVKAHLTGACRQAKPGRGQAEALITQDVIEMVNTCASDSLQDIRDRALILVGYTCALRRSELALIRIEDMTVHRDGANGITQITLKLRGTKTDKQNEGQEVCMFRGADPKYCPIYALREWLSEVVQRQGYVFRAIHGEFLSESLSDRSVSHIIQKRATMAGILKPNISGHSLRAGFVTQAVMKGAQSHDIMVQTRHKRIESMHGYIRRADLRSQRNPAATILEGGV